MKYKLTILFLDTVRKIMSIKKLRIAISILTILLGISLVSPYVFNKIAIYMFNRKDYSNAKTIWDISSKITMQSKDTMIANLGNTMYRQNQPELAIEQYEKALKYSSGDTLCKIKWNLTTVLASLGEGKEVTAPTEAISLYSRALLQLSDPDCIDNPEYKEQWNDTSKKLEEKIAKINDSLKYKRSNQYKPDPDAKEPDKTDRQNARKEILEEYRNQAQGQEELKLSDDERYNAYSESWW